MTTIFITDRDFQSPQGKAISPPLAAGTAVEIDDSLCLRGRELSQRLTASWSRAANFWVRCTRTWEGLTDPSFEWFPVAD